MKEFIFIFIKTSFGFRPDHFRNKLHIDLKIDRSISTKKKRKILYTLLPSYAHTLGQPPSLALSHAALCIGPVGATQIFHLGCFYQFFLLGLPPLPAWRGSPWFEQSPWLCRLVPAPYVFFLGVF